MSGVKCTNRIRKLAVIMIVCIITLTGCGGTSYQMSYDPDYPVSSFRIINPDTTTIADSFASGLCVTDHDITEGTEVSLSESSVAGLFALNSSEVLYARNVHEKLYPASLTKVMTALVALKYGNLDDVLVASENVIIEEYGAQVFGLEPGDSMTLYQALHILLMYSANDVAIMIAEHIGGSVEGFADMMNAEANAIGATNTHFVNPHGLSDNNHYTTAYDLYLMFQAAMQYEEFKQIIAMDTYTTVYTDHNGNQVESTVKTTNQYLVKNYTAPENVTVIGGKTGTTNAAGNCLILLVKDTSGNQYIAIVMRAKERALLYEDMNDLLALIYR